MLIILGLTLSTIIISIMVWIDSDRACGITSAFICSFISLFIVTITMCSSYGTYVRMKTQRANFETYAETISSYKELAFNIKQNTPELTDLKYQNYQKCMKDLIEDLRNACIFYNRTLISKNEYSNNPFFSWLTIKPDEDMKTVKLSDFIEITGKK